MEGKEKIKDRFAEFARLCREEQSFIWENGELTMLLSRFPVGKAYMVYGMKGGCEHPENAFAKGNPPVLVATIADGICYLENIYDVCSFKDYVNNGVAFPENVKQFSQIYKETTKRIGEVVLTEFLSTLPTDIQPSAKTKEKAKYDARRVLLGDTTYEEYYMPNCHYMISEEEFRQSLCGLVNLKEIAMREISGIKERCEEWKAYQTALADELEKGTAVEPWELRLNKVLWKLEESGVRTVTAKFECLNRHWETKMHLGRMQEVFLKEDTFFGYGFLSKDEGDDICMEFSHKVGRYPMAGDIVSISYRGKVVYERDLEQEQC